MARRGKCSADRNLVTPWSVGPLSRRRVRQWRTRRLRLTRWLVPRLISMVRKRLPCKAILYSPALLAWAASFGAPFRLRAVRHSTPHSSQSPELGRSLRSQTRVKLAGTNFKVPERAPNWPTQHRRNAPRRQRLRKCPFQPKMANASSARSLQLQQGAWATARSPPHRGKLSIRHRFSRFSRPPRKACGRCRFGAERTALLSVRS